MKFLVHIYKKLLTLFKFRQPKNNKISYTFDGCLLFGLDKSNIYISADLPNISDQNIEDITILAENYANFIVHITSGLVHEEIMNVLNTKLEDKSLSLEQKLFIDNIMHFVPILEKEIEISTAKAYMNTQPVIRPINVFNTISK